MILRKFKYIEYADTPYQWSLDGLILKNINLFVGKNERRSASYII
jgi:hypothetical protein